MKKEKDFEFEYKLLDRLRQDCDYYLGYGNRQAKYLWAGNEREQINKMKELYNVFPENLKPDWITLQDIEEYERKLVKEGVC